MGTNILKYIHIYTILRKLLSITSAGDQGQIFLSTETQTWLEGDRYFEERKTFILNQLM